MKSARFLIIAIIVGWIVAMAIIGYKMMSEEPKDIKKNINESVK